MTHTTTTPEQTFELAARLASELSGGDVVCLNGDLGAGKTAFTKGLAHGLGVQETITSPTFAIMNEYLSGRVPLFHFDVYRLDGSDGLEDTAFFDYIGGESVVVIEWAEQIEDILQEFVPAGKRVDITISGGLDDSDTRQITILRGTP
ncbi:MAG: tRNA (adenosine(37)-N6)-threonylcarbamoyltransferase complex ATPase subunit type 1 TsaE [Defluviitaleaceae bacterium]|nr:tRNA (adenosine(37)-N6)-threonylcarbamoyltransferase complex ATPase subunit type 1 TsaE [Defluviitaleaceae bacterium]